MKAPTLNIPAPNVPAHVEHAVASLFTRDHQISTEMAVQPGIAALQADQRIQQLTAALAYWRNLLTDYRADLDEHDVAAVQNAIDHLTDALADVKLLARMAQPRQRVGPTEHKSRS